MCERYYSGNVVKKKIDLHYRKREMDNKEILLNKVLADSRENKRAI